MRKKVYTKVDDIHYGETPLGTGPNGGHSGDQYMVNVRISYQENIEPLTTVRIVKNVPCGKASDEEIKAACKRAIDWHWRDEDIAKENTERINKALSKKNNLLARARKIRVSG